MTASTESLPAFTESFTESEQKFFDGLVAHVRGERKTKPAKPKDVTKERAAVIREYVSHNTADWTTPPFPAIPIPPVERKLPERLSVTTLRNAEKCILSARLAREYDSTGTPAMLGRLFHEVAERLATMAYVDPADPTGTVPFQMDPAIAVAWAEKMLVEPLEITPLSYANYEDLLDMVRNWAKRTTIYPAMQQYVEMDMRVPLDEHVISGRIDLVQTDGKRAIITDYKTSQRIIPQSEFENSVQTFLYAWGVRQMFPEVEEFTVREQYVRYDAPARNVTFGPQDLNVEAYMRVAAGRLMAAYDRDEWPTTPGDHCAFCPRPHVCPVRGISEYVPGDDGNAVRLMEWLAVVEAQVTQAKRTLKAEITQRGMPLDAHGLTAGFTLKHVERVDKERLAERLGPEMADYVDVDDRTEFHIRKTKPDEEAP